MSPRTRRRDAESIDFVVGALAWTLMPEAGPRPFVPSTLDGSAVATALGFHKVAATVAHALRGVAVPPDVRAVVDASRRRQAITSLQTKADLQTLAETLDAAAMPWAVVKGPAVAGSLYPDPLLRQYVDLDVLVSRHDMAAAVALLEGTGARLLDRNWPLIAASGCGELTLRMSRGSVLDLHWTVVNDRRQRATLRVPTGDLLHATRMLDMTGTPFPALLREEQLIHLAVHAFVSGGRRLAWLTDVALAAGDGPDWDRVLVLARRWGVQGAVGAILQRTIDVFPEAQIPPRVVVAALGTWRQVIRVADQVWSPGAAHLTATGHSGTELLWASRGGLSPSVRALVAELKRGSRARSQPGAVTAELLQIDVPDARARADWFAQLAGVNEP